jgi:hypothetical protein
MTRRISSFIAALLVLICCAAAYAQSADPPEKYVGRKFWYEPEHAKYWHVEFLIAPRFDRGTVKVSKKTQFEVTAVKGNLFMVRFEPGTYGVNTAYLPVRTMRSRLYAPKITESFYESFQNAAFFEEDPVVIKRRLDRAGTPAAKSPAAPPPWQIRHRGPARPALPEAPEAESATPQ